MRAALLTAGSICILCAAGCRDRAPKVLSAELIENKNPDGVARFGEMIRITLDRPAPADFRPDAVRVFSSPPRTALLMKAHHRQNSLVIDLELLSTPPFRPEGRFGGDPKADSEGPTGIGIDLGPAAPGEQWVDLQERRPHPVLVQAIWEDRAPLGAPAGNLVVDGGDWIRLVFDRDIRLDGGNPPGQTASEATGGGKDAHPGLAALGIPVEVPGDLILTSPEDRLDDGEVRSVFQEGATAREIRVVLGSGPRLTIAGRHRSSPSRSDRLRPSIFPSSGIALNGTPVRPLSRIVDRRGWPGAVSSGPEDIEFPPGYFFFEKRGDEPFPAPGPRSQHTTTPVGGGRGGAVVAGGRDLKEKAIRQVLLYNPDAPRPFQVLGELAEARYLHTSTSIRLKGDEPGTEEEFVAIAGGTDGDVSISSIDAVKVDPMAPEGGSVQAIEGGLRMPRMLHAAAFVPPRYLIVDGGLYSPSGGGVGIIPTAEVLELEARGGKVTVRSRRDVATIARMRHTATYLGKGSDGADYVLVYGGTGRPPGRRSASPPEGEAAPDERLSTDESNVLAAPALLRIIEDAQESTGDSQAGRGPRAELILLDYTYRFEMLRYDHKAVPVGFDPATVRGDAPREVLIAGGYLKPPNYDRDRPDRKLLEPPRGTPEDPAAYARGPLYTETADAVVFEFHPDDPKRSRFRVVESPTGDQRIHFALVPLPYPGVLILGGERPDRQDDISIAGEIYLPREGRLAPLAVPLASPRTRFGAFAVEGPAGATVHVLGGSTSPDEAGSFTAVERMRMEWK
jgi:hypothetical protein